MVISTARNLFICDELSSKEIQSTDGGGRGIIRVEGEFGLRGRWSSPDKLEAITAHSTLLQEVILSPAVLIRVSEYNGAVIKPVLFQVSDRRQCQGVQR